METGTMVFVAIQIVVCLVCIIAGIYFGRDADGQERKRIAIIAAVGVILSGLLTKVIILLLSLIIMVIISVVGVALAVIGILLTLAIPIVGLPLYIWKKILK